MFLPLTYRMGTGKVTKRPPCPPVSLSGGRTVHQAGLVACLPSEALPLCEGTSWSLGAGQQPRVSVCGFQPMHTLLETQPFWPSTGQRQLTPAVSLLPRGCLLQFKEGITNFWDNMGPRGARGLMKTPGSTQKLTRTYGWFFSVEEMNSIVFFV